MEQVIIQGRAGNLEAMLDQCGDTNRCAVLCHPHPLYGGSMFDAVVATMADSISVLQVSTLRFNFRGVGKSQGSHDKGEGERDNIVDAESTTAFFEDAKVHTIVATDHFFAGAAEEIGRLISEFILGSQNHGS